MSNEASTAEQQAANLADAKLQGLGISPDQITAARAKYQPGETPATPVQYQTDEIPTYSEQQRRTFAADVEYLVSVGKMNREQADAEIAKLNGNAPAQQDGELSPEAAAIDAAYHPAAAHEFKLPPMDNPDDPAAQQVDRDIRTWLSAGQFSREVGNTLAAEADKVSRQVAKMSPAQYEAWSAAEGAKLAQLFGPETEALVEQARQWVVETWAKQPGCESLIPFLENSGAGDSSVVIGRVISHLQMQNARMKK